MSAAEKGNGLLIIALGDSTTAGTPGFRSPLEAPPQGSGNEKSQYTYWIQQRYPEWNVLNRGVNAERSDQILKRFDKDVLSYNPQWVIILAGVNDVYQDFPVQWTIANLKALYEKAIAANIKVLACTILPYDQARPDAREKMTEINRWIHNYSLQRGLKFCDTFQAVEDPKRPGYLAGSPDGFHPGVQGYQKMGDAIADVLERWESKK